MIETDLKKGMNDDDAPELEKFLQKDTATMATPATDKKTPDPA